MEGDGPPAGGGRLPCVILMPNGGDEAQRKREAKVFPLAKAPDFARLLAEASSRFARDVKRVFFVPSCGDAGASELTPDNYVDLRSRLPGRTVLYVSCGEDFHLNNPTPVQTFLFLLYIICFFF